MPTKQLLFPLITALLLVSITACGQVNGITEYTDYGKPHADAPAQIHDFN
jgi:hypothetical protein